MVSPPGHQFQLTAHAAVTIRARKIHTDWIAAAIAHPERTEPDRVHTDLLHALRRIPDFGNRVVRVVYNPSKSPPLVITAYFDRAMKGRL